MRTSINMGRPSFIGQQTAHNRPSLPLQLLSATWSTMIESSQLGWPLNRLMTSFFYMWSNGSHRSCFAYLIFSIPHFSSPLQREKTRESWEHSGEEFKWFLREGREVVATASSFATASLLLHLPFLLREVRHPFLEFSFSYHFQHNSPFFQAKTWMASIFWKQTCALAITSSSILGTLFLKTRTITSKVGKEWIIASTLLTKFLDDVKMVQKDLESHACSLLALVIHIHIRSDS